MPLTILDPTPALVVIDLQKGITAVPVAHPTEEIVARAASLAQAFRQRGSPVALVNVAGVAPGRTDLDHRPKQDGVTQVVLAGLSTSAGVESTARAAHDLGYHVVLAIDAMSDRDANTHAHSVRRIFPSLGETASTSEILEMLAGTLA